MTIKAGDGRLRRSEVSRAAILSAAAGIVAGHGTGGLTHRAVASAAGVSHALVTYHFSTIDALRRATLVHAGSRLTDRLEEMLLTADAPVDVPALAAGLATHMVTDLREETVTMCELMAVASRDRELRPVLTGLTERIADLIEPLSGSRALAATAASALLGAVLTGMAQGHDADPETFGSTIAELINRFDPLR
jgi:DNA-binding transcriptional regulator YbjK